MNVLIITFGGVAAKPGDGGGRGKDKAPKARITWNTKQVEQTINAGQVTTITATLTSSTNLNAVVLQASGGLNRFVLVEPSWFDVLKAGTPTTVKLTVRMPVEGAHNQSGVIQVWANNKKIPTSLKVKLLVPGSESEQE